MTATVVREQLSESRKILAAFWVMLATGLLTGAALGWINNHVHGHNAIAGAFFGAIGSLPVWVFVVLAVWLIR